MGQIAALPDGVVGGKITFGQTRLPNPTFGQISAWANDSMPSPENQNVEESMNHVKILHDRSAILQNIFSQNEARDNYLLEYLEDDLVNLRHNAPEEKILADSLGLDYSRVTEWQSLAVGFVVAPGR